jgi:hypothetical protein
MGVDAQLYQGKGILLNPYYLSPEWKKFLNDYLNRDTTNEVILYDVYDDPTTDFLILWSEPPRQIMLDGRRALILNSPKQLELMKPTPKGLDIDNRKLWDSSYVGFAMMLIQHEGKDATAIVNGTVKRMQEHSLGELVHLINEPSIRLVGEFLVYHIQ